MSPMIYSLLAFLHFNPTVRFRCLKNPRLALFASSRSVSARGTLQNRHVFLRQPPAAESQMRSAVSFTRFYPGDGRDILAAHSPSHSMLLWLGTFAPSKSALAAWRRCFCFYRLDDSRGDEVNHTSNVTGLELLVASGKYPRDYPVTTRSVVYKQLPGRTLGL